MFGKKKKTASYAAAQEAIHTLMANIQFSSIDDPIRSVCITSSVPNEGKSTIAYELAMAFAKTGSRTLLIDCDLRRRSLADRIGVRTTSGIFSVLSGNVALSDAAVHTSTSMLDFLDNEPHIPNPQAILSSHRFEKFIKDASEQYKYVIVDTPPLGAFVDAAIVGRVVDGTVLVVRENHTKRNELTAAYDQLKKADVNVLGVCMNDCEVEATNYYSDYYTKDGKTRKKKGKRSKGSTSYPAPTISNSSAKQNFASDYKPAMTSEPATSAYSRNAGVAQPNSAQPFQVISAGSSEQSRHSKPRFK